MILKLDVPFIGTIIAFPKYNNSPKSMPNFTIEIGGKILCSDQNT